jgi:phosphatidylinositol 4-kinase B
MSSHLLVTQPSDSTALELLLLDTSVKSPHIAIRMQLLFLNYLSQFAFAPGGDKYRVCQDMYNRILSAQRGIVDRKFREHVAPTSVLVGGIMGAIGLPAVMGATAVVASRQARRERVYEEEIDAARSLHRSKSMNAQPTDEILAAHRVAASNSFDVRRSAALKSPTRPTSQRSSSGTHFSHKHSALMSSSSPNLEAPPSPHRASPLRTVSPSTFTDENITKALQTHYYSTQTQFLQSLQDISLKLRAVPKEARQSALRIELAGLDKWLPADVCLPNVCSSSENSHDRVVQIVESECTILNSAERVQTPPVMADIHRCHICC